MVVSVPFNSEDAEQKGHDSVESSRFSDLENALSEQNQLFWALMKQDGIGIAFLDANWHFVKANPKFYELFKDADLARLSLFDLVHPDDSSAQSAMLKTLQTGTQASFSTRQRYLCKNGTVLWSNTTLTRIEAENSRPQFYLLLLQDITEHQQAEAVYQQRETQLSSILNGMNASIARFHCSPGRTADFYHYDYVSASCQQVFGFTAAEFLADHALWRSRVLPEDHAQLTSPANITQAGMITAEYRFRHKDGSIRWIAGYVTIEWDADVQHWVMTAVDVDISDRKRTEAELQEKEAFLRSIYEGAKTSIFVVDVSPEGEFHFVGLNPAHAELTGLSIANLQGKTPEQVLPAEAAAKVRSHYQSCLDKESSISYEEKLDFQGQELWWQTRLTPLKNKQGQIYRIVGTSNNITRRILVEMALQQLNLELEERIRTRTTALQESEELFRQFFENMPQVFWVEDVARKILYISPGFEKLWGISGAVSYQTPQARLDMIHPEDQGRIKTVVYDQSEGNSYEVEYRVVLSHADCRWIRERAFPIYNNQGVVYRMAQTAEDITNQKQAEIEIRRSRDLFEAVFQESADAVFLVNPATLMILNCNQRAVDLFEANCKEQLIGRLSHILHCNPLSGEEQVWSEEALQAQALQAQEVWSGIWSHEVEYRSFKGNSFWGNVAAKIIQVADLEMTLIRVTDISQRKRAESQLQQQANREALLRQVAFRTRESLNLDYILNTSVTQVQDFLQVDRVLIYQFEPDGSGYIAVEAVSAPQFSILGNHFHDPCFSIACADHYQQGYVSAVVDIYNAGLPSCYVDFLAQVQVRANLVVPILQDGQLWGLLLAHHCTVPRQWQPFELDLLNQLADQVGIAIRQTNLYATLETELAERRRAEQALAQQVQYEQLLQSISQQIRSSLRLEEILATAVTQVLQVLQVDRVIVFRLYEDGTGNIIRAATLSEYPTTEVMQVAEERFPPECRQLYEQGQIRVITNVNTDILADCLLEFMHEIEVKSKLVAPIIQNDEDGGSSVWGLLILHTCQNYRQWQPAEIELMQKVAIQMGIAIQQSDLYFQLETQLKQKEVLLKEVHHRVKNNLQVISAMLKLQARTTQETTVLDVLEDSRSRLRAIALIHEILYGSENLEQLDFTQYVQRLASTILSAHGHQNHVRLIYQLQPICLNLDTAIPCGLLLSELITNAIKHAFPDEREGEILIGLEAAETILPETSADEHQASRHQQYVLTIRDNGVGMPVDLDLNQLQSLGLKIAYDLAWQLQGTLTMSRSQGTQFQLTFSELVYRKRL